MSSAQLAIIAIVCMFAGTTAMYLLLASLVKREDIIKPDINPIDKLEEYTGDDPHDIRCEFCEGYPEGPHTENCPNHINKKEITMEDLKNSAPHRDICKNPNCTWCNPIDKENSMKNDSNDPISPEEALASFEPHVWCIEATCIAQFPDGATAIAAYDQIDKVIDVKIGDKTMEVPKEYISVMPEYVFDEEPHPGFEPLEETNCEDHCTWCNPENLEN